MPITENARAVLERRYLIRDEKGSPIETVDGLFQRTGTLIPPPTPPDWSGSSMI